MINLARNQDNNKVEGALSSSLIYINAIDYVTAHLYDNINNIATLIVRQELGAVTFPNHKGHTNEPLGNLILKLKGYEFPDKEDFISDLEIFNKVRRKVAHRLLALTPKELEEIDEELEKMRSAGERIFDRYDTIVRGINASWLAYVQKQYTSGQTQTKPEAVKEHEAKRTRRSKTEQNAP